MAKLTDLTTNETELENQETQTIEEVEGVYYCERLENNKLCGIITTSTILATERGWLDNIVRVEDVEESEKDHCLYLKGYAPKKTTEEYFNEFKANLRTSVKNEFEKVAQERGFSGSVECTSYAMASNSQRKTWALIYLAWRDKADAWYDDWIDNKLKLQAKVPNLEEVLSEMPQINWDAKLTEV